MYQVGLGLLQQYPNAGGIFAAIFVLSIGLTGLFYVAARQYRLLPKIRERDVHTDRKPRLGGVAMWVAIALGLLWIATDPGRYTMLSFGHRTLYGLDISLWGILAGMLVILVFGVLDDLIDLKWYWQLLGQVLSVATLVLSGIGVDFVRLPFDHQLRLDTLVVHAPNWLGGQDILVWSALFTFIWVMAMINSMNFFDGLDGLAGSVAATAAFALFFVSIKVGFLSTATLALVVCAAAGGFLVWNWYPSKLFMGTVGSQLLGFLLAVIAIVSGGKVATTVLVLGIPIFDAIIVVIRRLMEGVSPLHGDQRHLHHRLLKIGIPTPWVVVLINAISLAFGIAAVLAQRSNEKGVLTLILIACMGLLILITYALERHPRKRVH